MTLQRLDITINGKQFSVVTDDEKSNIVAAAAYVEQMINLVSIKNKKLSVNQAQILAALNIADELYKLKSAMAQVCNRLSISDDTEIFDIVDNLLNEVDMLKDKLETLSKSEVDKMAEIVKMKEKFNSDLKYYQSLKKENEVLKAERAKLIEKINELNGNSL